MFVENSLPVVQFNESRVLGDKAESDEPVEGSKHNLISTTELLCGEQRRYIGTTVAPVMTNNLL